MTSYTEILQNQKYILEDITNTFLSGYAFYHLVQNIFIIFLVFCAKNMKIKMYRTIIFPVGLVGMKLGLSS
jgi:hypothetical protein